MSMNLKRGGFWIRLAACAIDLAILYLIVRFLKSVMTHMGVYIPSEATFLLLFVTYSTVMIGRRGATFGKLACGLKVCTSKGRSVGYIRAFVRESFGKFVAAVFLAVGYLWILLPWFKRGWHDYLVRTGVVRTEPRPRHVRLGVAIGYVLILTGLVTVGWYPLRLYVDSQHLCPSATVRPLYMDRNTVELTEISELTKEDESRLSEWLQNNGHDPADFVVQVAKQHDVTILGEVHFVRENLGFLHRLIPRLYHEAGVTCIAMECINANDNRLAEKIVTAPELRQDLILELARRHNWKSWGWKEYWDVLGTVWQLNRELPPNAKPMRVVGLMPELDLPSFALSGISDGYRQNSHIPVWERLRIGRSLLNLPIAMQADQVYARNIEREILDRGERGAVLVGAAHAPLGHRQPSYSGGRESARMGFMLHQQYGNRLAHILLHNNHSAGQAVSHTIENIVAASGRAAVGFSLSGSPLGSLRDSESYPFSRQPGASLVDLAEGYVLLKPTSDLQHCTWMDGYVSGRLFAEYKPFYEMLVGHDLRNAMEADRAIAETNAAP